MYKSKQINTMNKPKITSIETVNKLAYELCDKFQDVTEEFAHTHPEFNVVAAIGAANCYISSMLVQAPNKREALKTLDSSVEIIRNLINQTPDCFFGNRPISAN